MTLSELAEALSVPARQIRFLIAEGILPPATKTGRAADAYDDDHLARARRYMGLHRLGMKPGSIKVLMAFDDAIPIFQDDVVELRISPAGSPDALNVDEILEKLKKALEAYTCRTRSSGSTGWTQCENWPAGGKSGSG